MITYADTRVCPACRRDLPVTSVAAAAASSQCPACDLPLQHPVAGQLLGTLRYADELVAWLRAHQAAVGPPPVPAQPSAPLSAAHSAARTAPDVDVDPSPAPRTPQRHTPPPVTAVGVRTTSVPSILLGLGGLCLAVAAVIFLAVAWSWLGVGGRTAALVGLTVGAGSAATLLGRRGLRAAGESLGAVAAVLAALDVVGAVAAGWLDGSITTQLCVLGVVVAGVGLVIGAGAPRLVAPQVSVVLASVLLTQAIDLGADHRLLVPLAGVLLAAAGAWTSHRLGRTVLAWGSVATAAVEWLELVATSLERVSQRSLTLAHLWVHGPGWALLAATLLVLLPLAVDRREAVLTASLASAGTMATLLAVTPLLDDGATAVGAAALVATLGWTSLRLVVPTALRDAALVPALGSALPLVALSLGLVAVATDRVAEVSRPGLRLGGPPAPAAPWLLVPAVAALLVLAAGTALRPARSQTVGAGVLLMLAGLATLALYPVPLALVVGLLAATGLTLGVVAVGTALGSDAQVFFAGVAVTLTGLATLAATPDVTLLVSVCVALVALAGVLLVLGRSPGAVVLGGALLPIALGLLGAAGAVRLDVDAAHVGVPVLLVVGLVALVRPRVEVELAAAVAGFVAAASAIDAAADPQWALALHLTVAGVLVTSTSLVWPSRRPVAPVGAVLLLAATWVRLAEIGVRAPEAYTLPAAAVLLGAGLTRLWRSTDAGTGVSLTPGLLLGTVPSLLWVVGLDPVSTRAVLLGLGCLVLVLAGAAGRWSAPLLVGGAVGAALVLVELAPYAGAVPQWLLIGGAGALLTVVGVTWERRLQEVHRVAGAVQRLR